MTPFDTPSESPQGRSGPDRDIHLCNSYRQVLMAMADTALKAVPALVIYLEDDLSISDETRKRLQDAVPTTEIWCTRDAVQTEAFARLPRIFPALLRRNLSLSPRLWPLRPYHWIPERMQGERFATGYVYHSGFFMAKVIAGRCARVVLRESGLNMYVSHPVKGWPKVVFRKACGLPALYQTWGEERWVSSIEVSRPEALPDAVRHKATQRTLGDLMQRLAPDQARALATAFAPEAVALMASETPSALLLTQPLETIGICSLETKIAIYSQIAATLGAKGYRVLMKNHPREATFSVAGAEALPAAFPVEAMPYLGLPQVDLLVALCSASLDEPIAGLARDKLQLIAARQFNAAALATWDETIKRALDGISPTCPAPR